MYNETGYKAFLFYYKVLPFFQIYKGTVPNYTQQNKFAEPTRREQAAFREI